MTMNTAISRSETFVPFFGHSSGGGGTPPTAHGTSRHNSPAPPSDKGNFIPSVPTPGATPAPPPTPGATPSPPATNGTGATPRELHRAHGKPVVTVERDGDRVTSIRVQCGCGDTIELDCLY